MPLDIYRSERPFPLDWTNHPSPRLPPNADSQGWTPAQAWSYWICSYGSHRQLHACFSGDFLERMTRIPFCTYFDSPCYSRLHYCSFSLHVEYPLLLTAWENCIPTLPEMKDCLHCLLVLMNFDFTVGALDVDLKPGNR